MVGASEILRLLGTMLLLVGGLAVTGWMAKRSRGHATGTVRVVSRVPLQRGSSLAVVAIGRRRLLLATGEKGLQLLTEIDPDEIPEDVPVQDAPVTDPRPGTGLIAQLQQLTLRRARPSRAPRS